MVADDKRLLSLPTKQDSHRLESVFTPRMPKRTASALQTPRAALGTSNAVTVAVGANPIAPGASVVFTIGSNTYLAGITAAGGTLHKSGRPNTKLSFFLTGRLQENCVEPVKNELACFWCFAI
jgi:hypothetical protein